MGVLELKQPNVSKTFFFFLEFCIKFDLIVLDDSAIKLVHAKFGGI